ncbi:hypothetical protein ABBQ32_005764 [Trebouxia sp. C0010 RCD-2024]
MSTCRAAGLAQLLLLVCCLRLCTGLDKTEADSAGLKYKLSTNAQIADLLVRPSDTTTVSGTSPRSSLPQLATCGCPAAEQGGKAPGSSVVTAMQNLTAATWTVEQTIFLSGQDVFHTEGMVILDDHIYISAVEVLNRSRAEGRGWLFQFDLEGGFVDKLELGEGASYHPGGIDTDGEYIYVPLAEYHAGNACGSVSTANCSLPGTSIMYRVTADLQAERLFRFPDHLGTVAVNGCGPDTQYLDVSNWGSRTIYRFSLPNGTLISAANNQQAFVDFQDCQSLPGCGLMLCSGVKNLPWQFPSASNRFVGDQAVGYVNNTVGAQFQMGGLALVDPTTGVAVTQVPVTAVLTPGGNTLTTNPVWVADSFNGTSGLHFLFAPDSNNGSVVVTRPVTA